MVSLPTVRSPIQLKLAENPPVEGRVRVLAPGASAVLHAHAAPCAWRVLSGHALETVIGQPDRTWAIGEVGEIAPGAVHQLMNADHEPLVLLQLADAACPEAAVEAPPGEERIAIVGGGMSAAALTYHLARGARRPLHLSIVERGAALGRGIAYGVTSRVFRLNVPASRMSIDPEAPDDFVRVTDGEGRVVDGDGAPSDRLFAMGVHRRRAALGARGRGSEHGAVAALAQRGPLAGRDPEQGDAEREPAEVERHDAIDDERVEQGGQPRDVAEHGHRSRNQRAGGNRV